MFFLLVLIAVVLTGGSGSTAASAAQASGEVVSGKDTFVYALNAEPRTLSGLENSDFAGFYVNNNIFENLIKQNADGSLEPGLAEKWEFNEAGDEITFHLRKGIKFHNGEEMTADDVVYTYDHDIVWPSTNVIASPMDHMEKIDDYTCKLVLKQPFAAIEYCIAGSQLCIVSKADHETNGYAVNKAGVTGRMPIGTGPFKMVEWVAGDRIVLTRNDEYWGGKAVIKDVTFRIITDASTAIIALETGNIDMCLGSNADRTNLMNNPNITYHETPQSSTMFISFNNEKGGIFDNKDLRLAVAYATHREDLMLGALDGVGEIVNTPFSKNIAGYDENAEYSWYEYDLEKAKAHLIAAGYPDGVTITFNTMNSANFLRPTEVLQGQLAEAGIDLVINPMERAAWLENSYNLNNMSQGYITNASAFYPDADYIYAQYTSTGGQNYSKTRDPVLDELLEKARNSMNLTERKGYYKQVADHMYKECLYVPLWMPMTSVACNGKLRGFEISAMRRLYLDKLYWVE
jgi:peptide/nickel transport system substrate-binding protein